ncbi:DsbA family protein, partial [Paraburkholderia sp. SIMBA_061]
LARRHGFPADRFRAAHGSPARLDDLRAARTLATEAGIRGTPTLIVHGRYVIDTSAMASYQQLITAAARLLAR